MVHRIDASGNILKTYIYDVFGVEQDAEPLDTNPFRYCGEYFDKETGEIYLRARYYNPVIGRFGAEDLARTGDNYYIYCLNNPTLFTDPLGLFPFSGGSPDPSQKQGNRGVRQFLADEAKDKLSPNFRGNSRNNSSSLSAFGKRKNFYDGATDYLDYLKSGKTVTPELATILRQKALISQHYQFPGLDERAKMFYVGADILSWKNYSATLIDAEAGVGEVKILGGDKGLYLKVGATQGSIKAGLGVGGVKFGAEASLIRFTLGYVTNSSDWSGALNLGAAGKSTTLTDKQQQATVNFFGAGVSAGRSDVDN